MTVLVLDLTPEQAVFLTSWIAEGRRRASRNGLAVPAGLDHLEQVLAAHADLRSHGSPRVTGGHSGPKVGSEASAPEAGLMDYGAAARHLQCSVATVKRRVAAGDIVPVRHGRIVRFRPADLDQLGAQAC